MNIQFVERVFKSWRTSSIGLAGTAVAVYLFNALGCRWPETHEWLAVILPAVVGLVTRERK